MEVLISEPTPLGTDWYRVCHEHRWASLESVNPEHAMRCPLCAEAMEAWNGHVRYEVLKAKLGLVTP